jgi:maltose alpha-D-glucosyltransferase/alpha-amylase
MAGLRSPAFAPELITMEWQGRFCDTLREEVGQALRMLALARPLSVPGLDPLADRLINQQAEMLQIVERLEQRRIEGRLIRCHGDLHLGQVLHKGDEWVIIDFEGEPARSIPERRLKNLAFTDVAGMLRSFHYAICAAGGGAGGADDPGGWRRATGDRFLQGYFHEACRGGFLPDAEDERTGLLKICLLRKALYELCYELNHRPEWAGIPITGLLEIIGETG